MNETRFASYSGTGAKKVASTPFGNQSDGVTVARYPKSRVIGIRRPLAAQAPERPELKLVQQQLKDLGYYEVGNVDGHYGPRTRAAVLAFRADNGLALSPDVDVPLAEALQHGRPRAISAARAEGKPEDMVEKIAQGKLAKFYKDSTLLNQEYFIDNKMTVRQFLQGVEKDLTVSALKRYSLS